MKKISINAVREPLTIDINGEEVHVSVDLSTSNLGPLSQLCYKNSVEMRPIEEERDQAIKDGDFAKVSRMNGELAKLIEPIITGAIGQKGFDDILTALGGGEPIEAADCVKPLVQVMKAIGSVVQEHFGLSAAQMTAGAADALQTTDGE